MGRGVRTGVICVVTAALVGGGGWGAYNIVHAVTGVGSGSGRSDTPLTAAKATSFVQGFLDSWSGGRYASAASDTDSPGAAQPALQAFHDGLKLGSLTFGQVRADPVAEGSGSAVVHFHASLTVGAGIGAWSFDNSVTVHQQNGLDGVAWSPSVLYPGLKSGENLAAGSVQAPAAQVTDRNGVPLTGSAYPSLTDIVAAIGTHASADRPGKPGTGIAVVDDTGTQKRLVKTVTAPVPGQVRTTLDASLQKTAEKAVQDSRIEGKPASVVAIDPSDGQIRAVAFNSPNGNTAFNGQLAPGSTFKIITAAALFDRAGLTPSSPAPCTSKLAAASRVITNEDGLAPDPNANLLKAFAISCNTSFVKDGFDDLVHGGNSDVVDEARDVFGLGTDWSIGGGVYVADASVPEPGLTGDRADELIGQGKVTMNPLALASMAATVAQGAFHQPVILPGQKQQPAARPLSSTTDAYLRELMRATASYGTAAPVMQGISGGAKTGTAEVADHTNGWLAAYDGHLAVGALVEGGTHGYSSAGWVATDLLRAD